MHCCAAVRGHAAVKDTPQSLCNKRLTGQPSTTIARRPCEHRAQQWKRPYPLGKRCVSAPTKVRSFFRARADCAQEKRTGALTTVLYLQCERVVMKRIFPLSKSTHVMSFSAYVGMGGKLCDAGSRWVACVRTRTNRRIASGERASRSHSVPHGGACTEQTTCFLAHGPKSSPAHSTR